MEAIKVLDCIRGKLPVIQLPAKTWSIRRRSKVKSGDVKPIIKRERFDWKAHKETVKRLKKEERSTESVAKNLALVSHIDDVAVGRKSRHTSAFTMGRITPKQSDLPEELKKSISKLMVGYPRSLLIPDSELIKSSLYYNEKFLYVKNENKWEFKKEQVELEESKVPVIINYGNRESIAFIVTRMIYTFTPINRILREIQHRLPDFVPQSILDYGCGPGTATWAANMIWKGKIKNIVGVDNSASMIELAEKLNQNDDDSPFMDNVEYRRYLSYSEEPEMYDMVVANFVLSEISTPEMRQETILKLWSHAKDMLVIVERGTPSGFELVHEARELILQQENGNRINLEANDEGKLLFKRSKVAPGKKAHVFAPCPHDGPCPLIGKGWCHFGGMASLNKYQMEIFKYKKSHQLTRYSYVVLRKGPRPDMPSEEMKETSPKEALVNSLFHAGRVARFPLKRSGHVIIDTCSPKGELVRNVVSRSDGALVFNDARKCKAGDLWPHPTRSKIKIIENWKY